MWVEASRLRHRDVFISVGRLVLGTAACYGQPLAGLDVFMARAALVQLALDTESSTFARTGCTIFFKKKLLTFIVCYRT